MFWSDQVALKLKERKLSLEWVDDMKTPSGRVHVGSLRGVIIHDLIYKSLRDLGVPAKLTYVFNDMDPMDALPVYLPIKYREQMGKPLYKIPSPEKGFKSFAQFYAAEFTKVFNTLGCQPEIIWSHDLYESGKMDGEIKLCLDKTADIKKIYETTHQKDLGVWFPFQVICPKCGKLGSTKVVSWDGSRVEFICQKELVAWAQGCGYQGKISPYKGTGKLLWKIDWAAHWKVIGITCEWAGKDHMSKGGSYEITSQVCQKVLDYPPPYACLYEHFLLGGRKMSSSKGIGASAQAVSQILPPPLLRFLMIRTNYRQAINFDPTGETIPDLFDEYDQFAEHFYNKVQKGDDYARIWELSQITPPPAEKPLFPRFRDVANFLQSPSVDIYQKFKNIKKEILAERIKYAQIWLKTYAPDNIKFEVKDSAVTLDSEQKKYLQELIKLVADKDWQPEDLQQELYNLTKTLGIAPKKAFASIYLSLFGKTFGPKAAWVILENKQEILAKFSKIIQ